jgi:predicted anti-sigma-YlaC factor YlaD
MAQPARHVPSQEEDAPSLDPAVIERAYRRERARRRALDSRRNAARSSNARFWVVLAVLTFLTVFLGLTAWHQIQTLFGL